MVHLAIVPEFSESHSEMVVPHQTGEISCHDMVSRPKYAHSTQLAALGTSGVLGHSLLLYHMQARKNIHSPRTELVVQPHVT